MAYFVLLVLHDVEQLDQVVAAWEEAGVSGITILASTGMGRIRDKIALREDLPLIPSLHDLLGDPHDSMLNRIMFSVVANDEIVDRVVAATERITGQLDKPHTGIMAVMPIARVYGLNRRQK